MVTHLKYSIALAFALLLSCSSQKNVVDRYNYIQKPNENGVTIAWMSKNLYQGKLEWGLSKERLDNTLMDSAPKQEHVFEIEGLTPNTTYYYRTTANTDFEQPIDSFKTPSALSDYNFSFLHYGDCGTGKKIQHQIAKQMEQELVDFGLVAGDVDQGNGDNYDDVFFKPYTNMLRNTCHFTSLGNHDGYADKGETYLKAFYLPNNNPDSTERYYSFEWGNAKFICLDSNDGHGCPDDEGIEKKTQTDWLEQELATNTKKWVFVYFHHPPYTIAWTGDYFFPFKKYPYRHYQGTEKVRQYWMPLFKKYKVDFVLTGHSHCYQRGLHDDTHYVISGGSGTEDGGLLNGYYYGMDRIHINKDSLGNKLPKALKRPVETHIVAGNKIEEVYDVKGVMPTVDILIRQSQYVRFDVSENSVTFNAYNAQGMLIDKVTKEK